MLTRLIAPEELPMMGNARVDKPKADPKTPPAGPHDKPELSDEKNTPGTGMLPEDDQTDVEGPSG